MAEILPKAYRDPDGLALFGLELGENPNVRAGWDDVDDYHLLNSSPPEDADGIPLAECSGWEWSVAVEWVDPRNPSVTVLTGQGVKRITVTVKRDGVVLARLQALRSIEYPGT
jgi:hypothetical protein